MRLIAKKRKRPRRSRLSKELPEEYVTTERIEHFYLVVATHLRSVGTWTATLKRFPPGAIRGAIKQILIRLTTSTHTRSYLFDWGVEFEQLRDHQTINDFIEYLEAEYKIPNNWAEEACNYTLTKLEEEADALGKHILSSAEYYWLKRCERNLKKLKRQPPNSIT